MRTVSRVLRRLRGLTKPGDTCAAGRGCPPGRRRPRGPHGLRLGRKLRPPGLSRSLETRALSYLRVGPWPRVCSRFTDSRALGPARPSRRALLAGCRGPPRSSAAQKKRRAGARRRGATRRAGRSFRRQLPATSAPGSALCAPLSRWELPGGGCGELRGPSRSQSPARLSLSSTACFSSKSGIQEASKNHPKTQLSQLSRHLPS